MSIVDQLLTPQTQATPNQPAEAPVAETTLPTEAKTNQKILKPLSAHLEASRATEIPIEEATKMFTESSDNTASQQLQESLKIDNEDQMVDISNLPDELTIQQAQQLINRTGGTVKTEGQPTGDYASGFFGELPVITGGVITQGYGSPVNYERGGKHGGVDIATKPNTPIPSVEEGVVTSVVKSDQGFGNHVVVQNKDGSYSQYSKKKKKPLSKRDIPLKSKLLIQMVNRLPAPR